MKKYLFIICTSVLSAISWVSKAQDIHFSQFYDISTLRNPALTGIFSGEYKVGIDYRNQWAAVATPYNTVSLSGETRILVNRTIADYISFGLGITYDKAGAIDFTSQEIYPAICYNKAMDDQHYTYLSVGLSGGYFARFVDMSKMTFSSQYVNRSFSGNNPSGENISYYNLHNYDVGAGVSLNSSFDLEGKTNYYIGAAVYHLNHPTEVFTGPQVLIKLPIKSEFNIGIHFNMGEQAGLSLHGNYSYQEPYTEAIFGGLLTWHNRPPRMNSNFALQIGAYYRYHDAIIPTIRFEIENVTLGFSYDVTNSSLATAVPGEGATEINLFVKGLYNHRKNPRDPVMCPRFDTQVYDHFR